jgi:hypothetical protein
MGGQNDHEGREFPQFPKLPEEIRIMIWEAALPARVVNIRQRKLKLTIGEWEQKSGRSWPVFPGEMTAVKDVRGEVQREDPDEASEEAAKTTLDITRRFQQRVMRGRINNALGEPEFYSDRYREANFLGLYSDCPPPEILQVCREAFKVATRSCLRVFSGPASFAETWFDGDLDTLYIRFDTYWAYPLQGPLLDINDGFPVLDAENMLKISKLAILWDLEPNPHLGPGIRPLVEDWTTPVLKLFGGVEELVLVLKHYQDVAEGGNSKVYFIDPIDVDKALEIYNNIIPDPVSEDELAIPLLDMGIGNLDMVLLEEYRQNFGQGNPTWAMPKFVQKIAITEGVKKKLNDAKTRAEMVLKEGCTNELDSSSARALGNMGKVFSTSS